MPVGRGTPTFGSEWKRATAKWYYHFARFNTQGSVYAHRDNYLDVDPTYKDALGRPLLRLIEGGDDLGAALLDHVGVEARLDERQPQQLDRPVEICVVADDQRVLAAELRDHLREPPPGVLLDRPTGLGRAGEADEVDVARFDERRTGLRAEPLHDVEDAGR